MMVVAEPRCRAWGAARGLSHEAREQRGRKRQRRLMGKNEKGGLRRPECYRFFAFFFLDDFALRFLAICFSPSELKKDLSRTFGESNCIHRE